MVNTEVADDQTYPKVAILSDQSYIVTWMSWNQDGHFYGVYAQKYDKDDAKVGTEFKVNTTTNKSQDFPSICSLNDGKFVIVWQDQGSDTGDNSKGIVGQIYNNNTTKVGGEFKINTYTASNQGYPTCDGFYGTMAGQFVVTWESNGQDGSSYGIYSQRYNADGTKNGSESLVNTHTNSTQRRPWVATCEKTNDYIIVWHSYQQEMVNGNPDSSYGFYAQRWKKDGTKSGPEFRVNKVITGHQGYGDVACAPNGKVMIVWFNSTTNPTSFSIHAKLYKEDMTVEKEDFQVSQNSASSPKRNPKVISLYNNNFVMAWENSNEDGDREGVVAREYDNTGNALANEYVVNDYTTHDQEDPDVAGFKDGDLMYVYYDD